MRLRHEIKCEGCHKDLCTVDANICMLTGEYYCNRCYKSHNCLHCGMGTGGNK